MSVRLLPTSATLSTSAGSWKLAISANLIAPLISATYDDTSTARNTAGFTPTAGVNVQGVFLGVRRGTTMSGTLTIELRSGLTETGGSVTLATTGALTVNATNIPNLSSFLYFTFTAPWLADGTGVHIKVTASVASRVWLWRSTTAGDYMYVAIGDGDDASKIQAGDTAVLAHNVTLTQDESLTLAATNGVSIVLGDNATWSVPNPAAAITLDTGAGRIQNDGIAWNWKIGTSGSPVQPVGGANGFVWSTSLAAVTAYLFDMPVNYAMSTTGSDFKGVVEFYGATSTALRLTASADAAAGQKIVFTTEAIPASWADGDTITFAGKDATLSDTVTYTVTIDAPSKKLTVNANLDVKVLAGAAIVNITEAGRSLGIKINSTNQIYLCNGGAGLWVDYMVVQGVYILNVFCNTFVNKGHANTLSSVLWQVNANGAPLYCPWSGIAGSSVSNTHFINQNQNYAGPNIAGDSLSFTTCTFKGFGGSVTTYPGIVGVGVTISDVIVAHGGAAGQVGMALQGSAHTITTLRVFGACLYIGANVVTGSGVSQQRSADYGLRIGNAVDVNLSSSTFGVGATNTTSDIYHTSNTLSRVILTNCTLGSQGVNANYANAVSGSYLRWHNYGAVAGDHRSWEPRGTLVSTGFGLADTLVYNGVAWAAAAAGQFAFKVTPNGASSFTYRDNYPNSTTIGNCLSLPLQVVARVKSSDAATVPTLRVTYDGGTVVTQAGAGGAEQTLSLSFTPATSTPDIVIEVLVAGAGGVLYVGELVILKPGAVSIDTTRMTMWSGGLPLGTVRTFPSPASVLDELMAAHTIAGSLGKLLGDNVNATISSRSSHAAADIWDVATAGHTAAGTFGEWVRSKLAAGIKGFIVGVK